jgi:hypothetical protein
VASGTYHGPGWFGALFVGACLGAWAVGPTALVQNVAILSLSVGALAFALSRLLSTRPLRLLLLATFAAAGCALVATIVAWTHVGSALDGARGAGRFYLVKRGEKVQASRGMFYAVAGAEALLFTLLPAGFILGSRSSDKERPE